MTRKTTAAPCAPITVVTGSDVIAIPPTTITQKRLTFRADVADPMADLMIRMLAGFAQFERAMIRERQKEGIALEKAKGRLLQGPKAETRRRADRQTTGTVRRRRGKGRGRAITGNQPCFAVSVSNGAQQGSRAMKSATRNRVAACGHHGEVDLPDDSHEGEHRRLVACEPRAFFDNPQRDAAPIDDRR